MLKNYQNMEVCLVSNSDELKYPRKLETNVHKIKYKVLRSVTRRAFDGHIMESYYEIPKEITPGPRASVRCCIYKERAVTQERVKLAMGGNPKNPSIIEVIDIACDECPVDRFTVTPSCRRCIASRCITVCPKNAITKDRRGNAVIDIDLCIECGRCEKVCPFGAITENIRPCERSCKIGAISMNAEKKATIDPEKCITCGACAFQCPFGAIGDKSYVLDAVNIIKDSNEGKNYKVVAIVAPAIASQFTYAKMGQVVSAIKKMGIHDVVEAAAGADMVTIKEADELLEKGFLTSSCCPAFVKYIKTYMPQMAEHISHNLSPMAEIGRYLKLKSKENIKTIFIGPCMAKKEERLRSSVEDWVDCVLTFEELQAMLDGLEIFPEDMEEDSINDASIFGRIFARSGGLSEAVQAILKEKGVEKEVRTLACDGIEQCKIALLKASKNALDADFIEGMACSGGCIGGPVNVVHEPRNKMHVDKFSKEANQSILDSINNYKVRM